MFVGVAMTAAMAVLVAVPVSMASWFDNAGRDKKQNGGGKH